MMKLVLVLAALAVCAVALEKEVQKEAKEFLQVEAKVKNVAKAAVKGKERRTEMFGQKAVRRIRKRWAELRRRPALCKAKETRAMRDDCMTEYRRDRARTRRQMKIVRAMERCARKYKGKKETAARKKCVKKAAVKYLKLRPIRAVIKEDEKVVVKNAKAAVKAAKTGTRAEIKKRVRAAIAALYKRLADIETRKSKCHDLESETHYKECMVPVKALIKRNDKERELLRTLDNCVEVKNASERKRCVEKAEDALLAVADPGTPEEVPATVDDLDVVVVKNAGKILSSVKKLRRRLRKCESARCRRVIKRAIKREQRRMHGLKKRFSPRRKCLKKRAAARAKEFRARAKEHAELTAIHDAAMDCYDTRCTAEEEVEQKRLEKAIMKRRALFNAEWKKLRCPFVAPEHDEAARRHHKKHSNMKSLASMRQRLVELFAKLDDCDTGACKAKTRKDIQDLTELINLLSNVEARTLAKKRVDHSHRAALHRKLTKYYLLAADCRTKACRLRYRRKLRALTAALDKMDRDELGRIKESVKNQNKYYRMLQKALKRCPSSSLGHRCRQMVVHAFRAGTELRQKALLLYLRKVARTNSRLAVEKCEKDKKTAAACSKKAQDKLAKRLAQIKIREMRIEKRRALRLCEMTANKAKCQKDVEAEYARDKVSAKKTAAKQAAKDVKKVSKKTKAAAKSAKALKKARNQISGKGKKAGPPFKNGASTLTMSVAVLCVALVALLF